MKAQLFTLIAAAFGLAASASNATPTDLQPYAQRANTRADALLRAAGLEKPERDISIRAQVDADGRITHVVVLRSSGSPDIDAVVAAILRRIVATEPPAGLSEGSVTINVGRRATSAAEGH